MKFRGRALPAMLAGNQGRGFIFSPLSPPVPCGALTVIGEQCPARN